MTYDDIKNKQLCELIGKKARYFIKSTSIWRQGPIIGVFKDDIIVFNERNYVVEYVELCDVDKIF